MIDNPFWKEQLREITLIIDCIESEITSLQKEMEN